MSDGETASLARWESWTPQQRARRLEGILGRRLNPDEKRLAMFADLRELDLLTDASGTPTSVVRRVAAEH